ncbi:paired amphipathic helix protein Sin3-like 5 [Carex rostrata]
MALNQHDRLINTNWRRGNKGIRTSQDFIDLYKEKIRSKAFYGQTRQIYTEFGEILMDCGTYKIDMHEMKYKVANLFQDHDDLLQGFNMLFNDEDTTIRDTKKDVVEYVKKIKSKACGKTPDLCTKFRDILMDFEFSKISMHEVKYKVANLFHEHDDLLQDFYMLFDDEHITIKSVLSPTDPPLQLKAKF